MIKSKIDAQRFVIRYNILSSLKKIEVVGLLDF